MNTQDYIIRLVADATGAQKLQDQLRALDDSYKRLGMTVAPVTNILNAQKSTVFKNGEAVDKWMIQTQHADGTINKLTTTAEQNEQILTSLGITTRVTGDSTKQLTLANQGLLASQAKLALRALAVVPIWQAMRVAMGLVVRAVKDIISVYTELDVRMKKVMAVATYTNETQLKTYKALEAEVKRYYITSSRSIADITEAMYQLGTAGRSTEEMMKGFDDILNLAVGTFGNVAEAGKVVSGILNVFNKDLERVGSTSKKIQYITDLLADAWKNNQIELSEINTAMGYLASVGNALNIDLKTLISTTAVMSDGMLRGGKGARYLAQAFVQIAKESDKLRDLGVVFDPNKPLDFYNVMSQLKAQFDAQRGSLSYTNDLIDVFGDRGSRAILSVLTQWEKWNKELAKTPDEIEGTAQKLKQLAESDWGTILKKFWREATVSAGDEFAKSIGGGVGASSQAKQAVASFTIGLEESRKEIALISEYLGQWGSPLEYNIQEIQKMFTLMNAMTALAVPPNIQAGFFSSETGKNIRNTYDNLLLIAKVTEDLGVKPIQISTTGDNEKEISQQKRIVNFLNQKVEENKNILDAQSEIISFLNEEGIVAEELIDAYINIYNLLIQQKDALKEAVETSQELTFTERQRIRDLEDAHELSMLEISGVDSYIIKWQKVQQLIDKTNRARKEAIQNQEELIKKTEASGDENALKKAREQLANLPREIKASIQELSVMTPTQIYETFKQGEFGQKEALEALKLFLSALEDKTKQYGDLTTQEREELDIANQLAVLEASGLFTKEQMLNYEIQMKENALVAYKDKEGQIELEQLHNKLLIERISLIAKYSDQVSDAFSDSFTDILKGEDISTFFDKIGENMRESMAENFGTLLGELTAKLGGMGQGYGEGMYAIQSMFADAGTKVMLGTKEGADYLKLQAKAGIIEGADYLRSATSGIATGDASDVTGTPKGQGLVNSIMSAIPSALGGYSASGVAGGILGGLSGLLSSSFPIVGSILGIGSMLWGNIFGKKDDEEDYSYLAEEHQGIKGVASKIDITNSELSIVNRNLVALRNTIEAYILPESAYFASKSGNIDDEFSTDGRRGVT